jgi:hypothetical protein
MDGQVMQKNQWRMRRDRKTKTQDEVMGRNQGVHVIIHYG